MKMDPASAVAVRVTAVPDAYAWAHSVPQVMPAGLLSTLPLPSPAFVTVSVGPAEEDGGSEPPQAPTNTAQQAIATRNGFIDGPPFVQRVRREFTSRLRFL